MLILLFKKLLDFLASKAIQKFINNVIVYIVNCWVRLQPIKRIIKRKYRTVIHSQNMTPGLMKFYESKVVSKSILTLLEEKNPFILQNSIDSFIEDNYLDKYYHFELILDVLQGSARELISNVRAPDIEDKIGFIKIKPLSELLESPEFWNIILEKRRPGEYLSHIYRRLGQSFHLKCDWLTAKKFLEMAVQYSNGNDKERAKSLTELGIVNRDLGNYYEALLQLKEAMKLAKNENLLETYNRAKAQIAWIALHQGKLYYAAKIFSNTYPVNFHMLGRTYYEIGDNELALKNLTENRRRTESIKQFLPSDYFYSIGFDARWSAKIHNTIGNKQIANHYFDESKDLFKTHPFFENHLLLDQGIQEFRNEKLYSASEFFTRARNNWRHQKYLRGEVENTVRLGVTFFKLGEYEKALIELNNVIIKNKPMGTNKFVIEAKTIMNKIRIIWGDVRYKRFLKEINLN